MPKVSFSLEEQFSDLRSKDRVYTFKIENQGGSAINLFSVTPRIPENVDLVEVKSPSLSAVKAKHSALCRQLTEIRRDYLLVESKEFRDRRVEVEGDMLREMVTAKGVLRLYLPFLKQFQKEFERHKLRSVALVVEITGYADAISALTRFFASKPDADTIKQVFLAKTEQVSRLEEQEDGKSEVLATIEPDSFYAATYTLRFPRSIADPKKYNLAIEGTYAEIGKSEKHVGGSVESLIISPRPEDLTLIALVFSFLGVVLRFATSAGTGSPLPDYNKLIWATISASIVSIVLFNVYEFTSLGEKFKMAVGWRSALLIGLLCGLMQDRVLSALKAFVGA